MFTLARALQAIDEVWDAKPSALALSWNTPVQFDAELVARLVAQYQGMSARFASCIERADSDRESAVRKIVACAEELHRLRHEEALRLYPVIARGLSNDPVARRLFWQTRLVMLGLARRVFRRFDELTRAVRGHGEAHTAFEHVLKALAEYRQRNEAEIYPLYDLAGQRSTAATRVA